MTYPFTPAELWTDLGRLVLAAFLGGVVGVERRRKAQSAGLRTLMVLAAACCAVMQLSLAMPRLSPGSDAVHIAQSVLQGIGFLGAGAILRIGFTVHGLTTAVSIWAVAAIGLVSGAGLLIHAVALTVLSTAGLLVLEPLETLLTDRREHRKLVVESEEQHPVEEQVLQVLGKHRIRVDELGIERNLERHRTTLTARAACPEQMEEGIVVRDLARLAGVLDVRLE